MLVEAKLELWIGGRDKADIALAREQLRRPWETRRGDVYACLWSECMVVCSAKESTKASKFKVVELHSQVGVQLRSLYSLCGW